MMKSVVVALLLIQACVGESPPELDNIDPQTAKQLSEFYLNFARQATTRPKVNTTFSDWMRDLSELRVDGLNFADRTLEQIVLPGTHDSGAYFLTEEIVPGGDPLLQTFLELAERLGIPPGPIVVAWSLTQTLDFYQQMELGIRYFDLRAAWHNATSTWRTYHGTYGLEIEALFRQIAQFLQDHPFEIVVVEISGIIGGDSDNLDLLADIAEKELNLLLYPRDQNFAHSIREMVERNQRAIVTASNIVEDRPALWFGSAIRNSYPNSVNLQEVIEYNNAKALEYTGDDWPDLLFKISHTMTPNARTILGSILPFNPRSLLDLSRRVNPSLPSWAQELLVRDTEIGNILIVDFCEETEIIDVCVRANQV